MTPPMMMKDWIASSVVRPVARSFANESVARTAIRYQHPATSRRAMRIADAPNNPSSSPMIAKMKSVS